MPLTKKSDAGDYVDDFTKSKAPQFKGKSKKKKRQMAIAAYLSNKNELAKFIREAINEADPKKGTGKKPKGSSRRLYTDEDPSDTVKVKFSTRQDVVDTLSKKTFKSKSHARQSQVINLIHQRVRAAVGRTKDPKKKKRLKAALKYITSRKEASKRKTQRMKKEDFTSENVKDKLFGTAQKAGQKLLKILERETKQTIYAIKEIAEMVIKREKPTPAEQKKIVEQLKDFGYLAFLGLSNEYKIFAALYYIIDESGIADELLKLNENFRDGKKKGKSRPGRVKKAGASCKGSVSSLRAKAKKYGGEKGKMYHWCANMKGGKKK